ncbi:MAG: Uma2 family endonuclease [Sandaracinaceae bacterium]
MAERPQEMSVEDYLALDGGSELRHEYLNGVVVAMAGASPRHNVVAHDLRRLIRNALAGGDCTVFDSGQRVRVTETVGYVYPDLVVTSASPTFTDERPRSLTNPLFLVEVLSKSTRSQVHGAKLSHYRRLPTVREVLLVDSQSPHAMLYRRLESDEWLLRDFVGGEITLPSLDVTIPFAEIYAKTDGLPLDD